MKNVSFDSSVQPIYIHTLRFKGQEKGHLTNAFFGFNSKYQFMISSREKKVPRHRVHVLATLISILQSVSKIKRVPPLFFPVNFSYGLSFRKWNRFWLYSERYIFFGCFTIICPSIILVFHRYVYQDIFVKLGATFGEKV